MSAPNPFESISNLWNHGAIKPAERWCCTHSHRSTACHYSSGVSVRIPSCGQDERVGICHVDADWMQFLRWKDVTDSQNFHLASFSFPFLTTSCSSLTRCRIFHAACQIWISWQANAIGPTRCRVIIRVKLPELIALPCEEFAMYYWVHQTLVVETFEESFESFGFHFQSECLLQEQVQAKGPNFHSILAMSGASPSVPSTFGPGTSGESRPVWNDLSGSMFQVFWVLSSGETFMGAPISSNPNFGVSAASKASQVKQSVWLRKNKIKFVSGAHKCCSMNCILYNLFLRSLS